jgi:hypothetical protein
MSIALVLLGAWLATMLLAMLVGIAICRMAKDDAGHPGALLRTRSGEPRHGAPESRSTPHGSHDTAAVGARGPSAR